MSEEILVSIWCITYNHEAYIRDAIEGFLSQKTNFKYKIIIHDDASTDKTAEIIKEYEQKYPDLICGIYEVENQYKKNREGMGWLMGIARKVCQGKYIAVCEGDDYWIDCHKLQLQADYMEAHPECTLSLHNALQLDCQDGTIKVIDPYNGNTEKDISSEEIIMQYQGHPPTASVFCKRELIEMPDFFYRVPVGDYPLLLYGFTKGNIHYNSRIMSVYRWLSEGSYNNRLSLDKKMEFYFDMGLIIFLDQYDKFTNHEYHIWISNRIQQFALRAADVIDSNSTVEEYYSQCKKSGYNLAEGSEKYFERIELLRKKIFDMTYCSDQVREFVRNYKNIVVMGKGRFGGIIANQFENNEINFCGFAVSKKAEGEDFFMDKPVWQLSKIPFSKSDMGLVVAINPVHWDDILDSLKEYGIQNYICPFFV